MNAKNPNILILHTDQQRYDSLGCTGGTGAVTPNIDRLGTEGIIFDRHMTGNPVCSPSRACLMTGMTAPGHGLTCNGMSLWRAGKEITPDNKRRYRSFEGREMPDKVPTIADICREQGYDTAAFGKLHLQSHLARAVHDPVEAYDVWADPEGGMQDWTGPYYGFGTVRMASAHGELNTKRTHGAHYAAWLAENHPEVLKILARSELRDGRASTHKSIYMSNLPAELHNSLWLADEFRKHVKNLRCRNPEKPFMAFVGFPDPHHPWTPPKEIAEKFLGAPLPKFAVFHGEEAHKPAPVLHEIERTHQDAESISLAYRYTQAAVHLIDRAVGQITETLREEGLYDDTIIVFTSDHGDYLGDFSCLTKSFLISRALVHVPLVIKPQKDAAVAPGRYAGAVVNYDVLPTLLELAGLSGHNLIQGSRLVTDGKVGREESAVYIASYANNLQTNNLSLVDGQYRYTCFPLTGEEELYDHAEDFLEERNLAGEPVYRNRCREWRYELGQRHMRYDLNAWGKYSLY